MSASVHSHGTVALEEGTPAMRAQAIVELVDAEQLAAVLAPAGPLLIVAGAGTGKTRTLTCRLAYRVASCEVPAGSLLAVTHSTKAAVEMKERFLRLGVDGLETAAVRTIHAAARRQVSHFWSLTGRTGSLVL